MPAPRSFALTLLGLCLGCTAILNPRDDVERCGTADDCDQPADNRWEAVCIFDEANQDLDSTRIDKVCVPKFVSNIGCNPEDFNNPEHPYRIAFDDFGGAGRYASGCGDFPGVQGCAPPCANGLVENVHGVCDVADAFPPAVTGNSDVAGQDVMDQFCRSYFCDDTFVCANAVCAKCEEGRDYGDGGCGDLYVANPTDMMPARSCIYQSADQLSGSCAAPDSTTEQPAFGACQ